MEEYIKWGNCVSSAFSFSNGARQGSVLSKLLFCAYFDKTSQRLNQAKVDCKIRSLLLIICFAPMIYVFLAQEAAGFDSYYTYALIVALH